MDAAPMKRVRGPRSFPSADAGPLRQHDLFPPKPATPKWRIGAVIAARLASGQLKRHSLIPSNI
jgi:hypothetical protein